MDVYAIIISQLNIKFVDYGRINISKPINRRSKTTIINKYDLPISTSVEVVVT